MNAALIFRIVSYITASMILFVGIIVTFGWFIPAYIPENMRIILGVMMILWGIYRIATTRKRQQHLEDEDE